MIKLAALALLLLAGCDKPVPSGDLPVFAEEEATAKNRMLEQRVAELERQVATLRLDEAKDIRALAEITRADADDTKAVNAELERLADTDDAFRKNIDYLGTFHNVPPQRTK